MATAAQVTMLINRIRPGDFRQRSTVLPAGSTTPTTIASMPADPTSPTAIASGTAYADGDTIQLVITGTQADLKALGY